MTRINCVPVTELCRQHLLAEYRELPRVFGSARQWYAREKRKRGNRIIGDDLPLTYCLGKGHVKFFYSYLGFLRRRHAELVEEMKSRGYSPVFDCSDAGCDLPHFMQSEWDPPQDAIDLSRQRIRERLKTMRIDEADLLRVESKSCYSPS